MPTPVSDLGSNKAENIEHAAEVLGRSGHRRMVFRTIYTGSKPRKTVDELMKATGLTQIPVLHAGKYLASQGLVHQVKVNHVTAYEKINFFQVHRDRIIRLSNNPKERKRLVTKRRPALSGERIQVDVKISQKRVHATRVSVEEIDSFSKVKAIPPGGFTRISESSFIRGVVKILGDPTKVTHWGGENRDLFSTRLRVAGKSRTVAVAFKGPGKTGKLTPGKMGKNGDQIQRLVTCPADVFLVQYWKQIDDSVLQLLKDLVRFKSYVDQERLWYGLIDGIDSTRLMKAYPKAFAKT